MIWLYPHNNTFTVFYQKPNLPDIIEIEELPEGSGTLRMDGAGGLYWENPTTELPTIEPLPVPDEPDLLVKIYAETQYQTMLLEMKSLGGM